MCEIPRLIILYCLPLLEDFSRDPFSVTGSYDDANALKWIFLFLRRPYNSRSSSLLSPIHVSPPVLFLTVFFCSVPLCMHASCFRQAVFFASLFLFHRAVAWHSGISHKLHDSSPFCPHSLCKSLQRHGLPTY